MSKEIDFVKSYTSQLNDVINLLPAEKFIEINIVLQNARDTGKFVFMIGNGGSASAASHMVCDFGKNTRQTGKRRIRAISLNDNIPSVTAYSNDEGYNNIFSEQLQALGNLGDILIAISGSGNSANIIKTIETAKKMGMVTIGMTGFKGGKMKDLVDICLIVPSESMEMIEDVHLIINHILAGLLRGAVLYGNLISSN